MDVEERRRAADALRSIRRGGEGWYSLSDAVLGRPAPRDEVVARLAELIDPGEDVSMSAYDLLPEEDRETLRWVKESGGIDAVQKEVSNYVALCRSIQDADNRRIELCSALCIDSDTGWSDAMAEMLRRLLPVGIEWPRFVDGEPVRFGDVGLDVHGKRRKCHRVMFTKAGFTYVFDDIGRAWWANDCGPLENTEIDLGKRVKRPTVLAADGEPLEKGQTVYLPDGTPLHVTGIGDMAAGNQTVFGKAGNDIADCEWEAVLLTHHRPVLDADGVPIRVGDEMYGTVEGGPFIVTEVSDKGSVFVGAFPDTGMHGSMLTHTKPEPIDTWQRIEEDAGCTATKYNERRGTIFTTKQQVARDLVRRAKKLAGVDND